MKPLSISVVLAALLIVSVSAGASTGASSVRAKSASVVKISLRKTSLGKVLVENHGDTLYEFTKDPRKKDTCVSISECTETWPVMTASGKVAAGPGVKASLLSTIKLANGTKQVVYAGHPLYRYAFTNEQGETNYVGLEEFGGKWDALNARGSAVK